MTLEEATRALREDGAMDAARKRALRDRVLAPPRKRPLRAIRWAMPIAAVLAAASVWASVRERHAATPPPVAPAIATTVVAPVAAPVVAPVVAVAAASITAPVQIVPRAPAIAKPAPDDGERRALRAYREAEHLQFDDKDYARALDAWDRYVPLAGKSPLLVDAKWQRALCLVHLGRAGEAREALEPFARGDLGAYRQSEARTILDTLQ